MQRKTTLITGASRGIGAACAMRFAKDQYDVIVHYNKHEEEALALCRQIQTNGGQAFTMQADLAKPQEVKNLAERVLSQHGGVDVLINNAGTALYKMLCDTTEDDLERIFNINILSMMTLTQALLPPMIHKKEGHIINLSSIWGLTGASCEVAYSTTKAAVIGFTKSLAKELGPSGILVNCVAPGVIDTDMNQQLDEETRAVLCEETPLGRLGTAQEVAETVFFLSSQNNTFMTGQVVSPNGGILC